MTEFRFSDNDVSKRDVPSFIEPRPPLISNPFMRPKPQKGTNLLELFEEDSDCEEPELVQVYLRLKPCNIPNNLYEVRSDRCLLTSLDTTTAGHGRRTQHNVSKMYTFSRIFGPEASQKEIFDNVVKDNLRKLPEGHNFTLLTYGASGSGKTYTLMGTMASPGLVPRSLEYVFRVVEAAQQPLHKPFEGGAVKLNCAEQDYELQWVKRLRQVSIPMRDKYRRMSAQLCNDMTTSSIDLSNRTRYYVWVSFVEIYNEAIYDLLAPGDRRHASKLLIREDSNGAVYVKGATQAFVRTGEEAYDVMVAGKLNLQVAATGVHATSSRSHCIFTITMLTHTDKGVRVSCVRLCDLAGCERARRTRNTGARMQESRAINSSLHVLERCLHTLRRKQCANKNALVPYRESKLTRLLGAGLSGMRGEAVSMVVTLNPSPEYAHETKHVLQLAAVARHIQIDNTMSDYPSTLESSHDSTISNQNIPDIMKLRAENERLHFELIQAQARNKELIAAMEERQAASADTMREVAEEAKDITRQYYEAQLQAMRDEMKEMAEEYENRLSQAAASTTDTMYKSLQNKITQLMTEIAILQEKLNAEKLARARAQEEYQHLQACIDERDENVSNEDVISVVDSDNDNNSDVDEDPCNESLEPTFTKEDINKSRTVRQSLQQEQHRLRNSADSSTVSDGSMIDESDSVLEKSTDTIRDVEKTKSLDETYATVNESDAQGKIDEINCDIKRLNVTEGLPLSNNDPLIKDFNSYKGENNKKSYFYDGIDPCNESLEPTFTKEDINKSRTVRQSLQQEQHSLRNSADSSTESDGSMIDESDNVLKKSTDTIRDVEKTKSLVETYATVNESDAQGKIDEINCDIKRLNVTEGLPLSNNDSLIKDFNSYKGENNKKSYFYDGIDTSVSLKADEIEDMEKIYNDVENNANSEEVKNMKNICRGTYFVSEPKVQKESNEKELLTNIINEFTETTNVKISSDTYYESIAQDSYVDTESNELKKSMGVLDKNKEINTDKNVEKVDDDVQWEMPRKTSDTLVSKIVSSLKSVTNNDNSLTQFEQLEKDTEDRKSICKEDIQKSFNNIKILKEKRNYFDDDTKENSKEDKPFERKPYFDNISANINKVVDKRLTEIGNKIEFDDLRSPSIVKDEVEKDFEPNTIKRLLGESITRQAEPVTYVQKQKTGKKQDSMDVFDSPTMTTQLKHIEAATKSIRKISISDNVDKTENLINIPVIKVTPPIEVMKKTITKSPKQENPTTAIADQSCKISDNTIEEFENIYKDISVPRVTEFELLLNQEVTDSKEIGTVTQAVTIEETKYNLRNKSHSKQEKTKIETKKSTTKNLDEEIFTKSEAKSENKPATRRNLRLRRRKNMTDDEWKEFEDKETQREQKLKDIVNLQTEFSDVTIDVPAPFKETKDIQSPEKSGAENVRPIMDFQSCPSKSVTRSRRKLFTPRAEPLEESLRGEAESGERVCVPRPSYHRPRARRKL